MTLEEILAQLRGGSFPLSHVGGGPVVDLDRAEIAAEEAYEAGGQQAETLRADLVGLAGALKATFSCTGEGGDTGHNDIEDCWHCWADTLLDELGET